MGGPWDVLLISQPNDWSLQVHLCRIWSGNPKVTNGKAPLKVAENERAKILWDSQIQTNKMVMENQPDTVEVDKEKRKVWKNWRKL